MLLYATSDIHVDSHELNWQLWEQLAQVCEQEPPDLLLICGDLSESLSGWHKALERFSQFPFPKLIVPGNHDLWSRLEAEPDSFSKYEKHLGEVSHAYGWHYLPLKPWVQDGIGVAGSCCWYDYSLLPPVHPFSREELEQKTRGPLRWMDSVACDWPGLEREGRDFVLTEKFYTQLQNDLDSLVNRCDFLILATHFPFYQEFLRYEGISWERAYFGAFMGSARYRDLLTQFSVDLHICGHLHRKEFLELEKTKIYLSPVGTIKEWAMKDPKKHLETVLIRLEAGSR